MVERKGLFLAGHKISYRAARSRRALVGYIARSPCRCGFKLIDSGEPGPAFLKGASSLSNCLSLTHKAQASCQSSRR
ncbi:hypothetical protein FA13DRAFT_1736807 [Coprinellus micaceus]|uniref:Uncharacterized protein n=1 Tax=Coprinellus micaceus TaxID=71717 RepID=A0A4Y7T0H7_COPMI|nr:hypothetical protein FA13DRAFT_1736807 [Coprinellus micaceus]